MPRDSKLTLALHKRRNLLGAHVPVSQSSVSGGSGGSGGSGLDGLPAEILLLIARQLELFADVLAVSQVSRCFLSAAVESIDDEFLEECKLLELSYFVIEVISMADIHEFGRMGVMNRFLKKAISNRCSCFFEPRCTMLHPHMLTLLRPLERSPLVFTCEESEHSDIFNSWKVCLKFRGNKILSTDCEGIARIEIHTDCVITAMFDNESVIMFDLK